jgi:hypothetical protein
MGDKVSWLLHDDQKNLFELLLALALNVLFLALSALLLWPLDRLVLVLSLAKGYGILWLATFLIYPLLMGLQHLFRVNLYDHANAFVISNLAVSCLLQVGWSAFAAMAVHGIMTGAPVWLAVLLYLVGVLSCLIAFFAVSSFFQGAIYKLVSLPLALVSFLAFSVSACPARQF